MSEKAERLRRQAAKIRATYEPRLSGGDVAEINVPMSGNRQKKLKSWVNAMGQIAKAAELETEAARLLGEPDPHAPKIRTDEEIRESRRKEADEMDLQAADMEIANPGMGAEIFDMSYDMRRKASRLRDESKRFTPLTVSEYADMLERDAEADEDPELGARRRAAAKAVREGSYKNKTLLLLPDRR